MAYVKTPRGMIYYELANNSKPPLVMCQGLSRSIEYWMGFDKELHKYFNVILVESGGIGRSAEQYQLPWNFSMFDYADNIVAVLDELKIAKAPIFGLSLGGMVTLAMGIKYPERVQSLVALNTSVAGQRTFRMSPLGMAMIAKTPFLGKNLSHDWARHLISKTLPNARQEEIRAAWEQVLNTHGFPAMDNVAKQVIAALNFKVTRELKEISVPTMIAYGDQDIFVPYDNSIKIHSLIPNAKLVKIEGAGHEAHLCQPEALVREVVSFIESLR